MLSAREWFISHGHEDIYLYPENIEINSWNTLKLRELVLTNPQLIILSFLEADWDDDEDDEANGSSFWMFSFFVSEGNEDIAIEMIDNDIIEYNVAAMFISHSRRMKIFKRIKSHIHPTIYNINEWITTYPEHRRFLKSSMKK